MGLDHYIQIIFSMVYYARRRFIWIVIDSSSYPMYICVPRTRPQRFRRCQPIMLSCVYVLEPCWNIIQANYILIMVNIFHIRLLYGPYQNHSIPNFLHGLYFINYALCGYRHTLCPYAYLGNIVLVNTNLV